MKPQEVPMSVRIGVTTALVAATAAGAIVPKDANIKTGAGVVGSLATVAYAWWAFKEPEMPTYVPPSGHLVDDNTQKTLLAVGVGVAATATIATAMYFLGGREAPKMPSVLLTKAGS